MGIVECLEELRGLCVGGALSDAQYTKAVKVAIAESKAASALLLAASVAPSPARWPQTRLPANQFPYDHALRMSQTTTSVLPFDIVSRIIKEADGGRYAAKQKMDKVLVDLLKWRARAPCLGPGSSLPSPSWNHEIHSRGPITSCYEAGSDEWYQVALEADKRAATFNRTRTYEASRNMTQCAVELECDQEEEGRQGWPSARNFSEAFQAVVYALEAEFEEWEEEDENAGEYGIVWEFRNQDLGVAEDCW
jgi:hypothetical protein